MKTKVNKTIKKATKPTVTPLVTAPVTPEHAFFESIVHFFKDANGDASKLYFDESFDKDGDYVVRIRCKDSMTFISLGVWLNFSVNDNLWKYDHNANVTFESYKRDATNAKYLYTGFLCFMPSNMVIRFTEEMVKRFPVQDINPRNVSFEMLGMFLHHYSDNEKMLSFKKYDKQYSIELTSATFTAVKAAVVKSVECQVTKYEGEIAELQKKIALGVNSLDLLKTF